MLDPTFGTGGIAYGPQFNGPAFIYGATLDEAGRAIVATGDSIMRFTTTGAVDTSFEPSDNGVAPALAATTFGEILLSPTDQIYEVVPTGSNIGIARFLGDSVPAAMSVNGVSGSAPLASAPSSTNTAASDAVFAAYAYPETDETLS